MKQTVRIIGGQFRGKKLSFPVIEGLRPTPDRVRETLFNWLMHDIHEAVCLDAFAGSGALGFEAFSRGAGEVVMLEKNPQVYVHLCKLAATFNTANIHIQKVDAIEFLNHTDKQFDLIFLDPPFSQNYLPHCLTLIAQSNLLKPNGLVYLESPIEMALEAAIWQPLKLKKAGQVIYGLYKKITSA